MSACDLLIKVIGVLRVLFMAFIHARRYFFGSDPSRILSSPFGVRRSWSGLTHGEKLYFMAKVSSRSRLLFFCNSNKRLKAQLELTLVPRRTH